MVLPPTEAALRREQRRLFRLNKRYPQEQPSEDEKQKWKDMASKAATTGLQSLYGKQDEIGNTREEPESLDIPEESMSVQIAMTRGSKLGTLEENESEFLTLPNHVNSIHEDHYTFPTVDSNTLSSTLEEDSNIGLKSMPHERKKQKIVKKSKRNPIGDVTKKKTKKKDFVISDITKEAWMCGCCGKVFSTFEKADIHEIACIQKAIQKTDLQENTTFFFRGNNHKNDECESQQTPERNIEHTSGHGKSNANLSTAASQPYPLIDMNIDDNYYERKQPIDNDLLKDVGLLDDSNVMTNFHSQGSMTKRKPATSLIRDESRHTRSRSRIVEVSPRAQVSFGKAKYYSPGGNNAPKKLRSGSGGDILLTKSMKRGLTKTDEALVNTVRRSEPYILTPIERQAEEYLIQISKTKMYYEDMAEQASLLKADPRRKYKTDGKNIKEKIQNKFVDAWQLIKEGDTGGSAQEDFYEKKKRKHKSKDDDGDVLVHDRRTHYINVVVNNSATVVQTELKRWAGNRWAENSGRVGDGDFEQFRKLAHVGIMKLARMAVMADFTPRNVAVQLSNNLYR